MKKEEMIERINESLEVKNAIIVKIYGVTNGVGYDLTVETMQKNTGEIYVIKAHANKNGWAFPNHLRPNNPYYQYTGKNDVYRSKVIDFWEERNGLKMYLYELKKTELQELMDYLGL